MKKFFLVSFVCLYILFFSALAIADDGSATSVQKDEYVVVGAGSGTTQQANTLFIFDSKNKYVWVCNVRSGRIKWDFQDLSKLEGKQK